MAVMVLEKVIQRAEYGSENYRIFCYNHRNEVAIDRGGMDMCTKPELQIVLNKVRDESKLLYGSLLDKIILYGSYARGDNTEESDVDIMIVLDCGADKIEQFRNATYEMASDISLEQEVFLSIFLKDKKHFEDNLDFLPFYRNIQREGISVYG